jgi:hypothetical protein
MPADAFLACTFPFPAAIVCWLDRKKDVQPAIISQCCSMLKAKKRAKVPKQEAKLKKKKKGAVGWTASSFVEKDTAKEKNKIQVQEEMLRTTAVGKKRESKTKSRKKAENDQTKTYRKLIRISSANTSLVVFSKLEK